MGKRLLDDGDFWYEFLFIIWLVFTLFGVGCKSVNGSGGG